MARSRRDQLQENTVLGHAPICQRIDDLVGLQAVPTQAMLRESLDLWQPCARGFIHLGHGVGGEKLLHIEQTRNDLLINHGQQRVFAVIPQVG